MNCKELASKIDHTYLKLDITTSTVKKLINETISYGFRSLVIPPYALRWIDDEVKSNLKLCSVVSFPLGLTDPKLKVLEAEYAFKLGAQEVDIVSNISLVKSRYYGEFRDELAYIVEYLKSRYPEKTIKVIGEVTILDYRELVTLIEIINDIEPDFFKTSTGFGPRGTTVEEVTLIREKLGEKIKLKASGGIRTLEKALKMLESGADVIGTSSAINIMNECLSSELK